MKVIACIVGLIALIALRSAVQDGFQRTIVAATSDKASTCLEMLGNTTSIENGQTYIIGDIKNSCNRDFLDVTITFKLSRSSGANFREGIAYAYSRDVKPGETRRFKSAIPISNDTVYRFDKIRAY